MPHSAGEAWFTERMLGLAGYSYRIKRTLHSEQSAYQQIDAYETHSHGNLLVLDGCIMLTERDEFIYHELLAHVAAQTIAAPSRAAVVGGGDGGVVRELLKYPELHVSLVEIDERVVRVSERLFPKVSAGLRDPRVSVLFEDGAKYLASRAEGELDLIVVDSTDPVGPATALVQDSFYAQAARVLSSKGVFVAQTQSPFFHAAEIRAIYAALGGSFDRVWMYWGVCPSYPGQLWTFCYASKGSHPLDDFDPPAGLSQRLGTGYYSAAVHRAAFALPPFVQALLPEGHSQRVDL